MSSSLSGPQLPVPLTVLPLLSCSHCGCFSLLHCLLYSETLSSYPLCSEAVGEKFFVSVRVKSGGM